MEQLEGSVELHAWRFEAVGGFHVASSNRIAGGPIELEFSISVLGKRSRPLCLMVGGDRARRRLRGVGCAATFDGVALKDPYGDLPFTGGPVSALEIPTGESRSQRFLLNDFLALEKTRELLEPGAAGQLFLTCRRAVPLAFNKELVFDPKTKVEVVEVELALELRRDDDALVALVEELIRQVRNGPAETRSQTVSTLLSLRAPPAKERWRTLADHPDPGIAERVRSALPT